MMMAIAGSSSMQRAGHLGSDKGKGGGGRPHQHERRYFGTHLDEEVSHPLQRAVDDPADAGGDPDDGAVVGVRYDAEAVQCPVQALALGALDVVDVFEQLSKHHDVDLIDGAFR